MLNWLFCRKCKVFFTENKWKLWLAGCYPEKARWSIKLLGFCGPLTSVENGIEIHQIVVKIKQSGSKRWAYPPTLPERPQYRSSEDGRIHFLRLQLWVNCSACEELKPHHPLLPSGRNTGGIKVKSVTQDVVRAWLLGLSDGAAEEGQRPLRATEKTFYCFGKRKREMGTWPFRAALLEREMRGRLENMYSLHFTGRITALHCKYSRGGGAGPLGPGGDGSVNSLATAAVIVWETGRLLFRSDTASLQGRRWDFLSAIQLLSVMTEPLKLQRAAPADQLILTTVCTVRYKTLNYTQIQINNAIFEGSVQRQMDHYHKWLENTINEHSDMFSSCTLTPHLFLTSGLHVHNSERESSHISLIPLHHRIWPGLFMHRPSKFHSQQTPRGRKGGRPVDFSQRNILSDKIPPACNYLPCSVI